MKAKISFVTLGVRDFFKSFRFYRDGLGFEPHNYTEGEEHVIFKLEGTWLSLYPRDKLSEDATITDDGRGFGGITLAHNEKSKGDVDRAFKEAIAAGARSVKTPQDVFWGGYSGYFADPDGYLWEVAWNPYTDLT